MRISLASLLLLVSCASAVGAEGVPADAATMSLYAASAASGHGPLAPAKGRFLVASRSLVDPTFAQTVVLLLSYGAQGALGVVINRPTTIRLRTALPQVEELRGRADPIYLGGPVAANLMLLLVRAPRRPKSAERIFGDVYASGSMKVLRESLANRGSANRVRAYAGNAGWAPGQLEREIARGDWYVAPAEAVTVFESQPDNVWPKLIERVSGQWTRAATSAETASRSRSMSSTVVARVVTTRRSTPRSANRRALSASSLVRGVTVMSMFPSVAGRL